jgi:crotonobetainyl-CoA:carnitine CoA-transferase CaiB-like acyl-CoA transferase
MYWAIGNGVAAQQWPKRGGELVTGGSPRYNVYRTADGKYLAAAPLEQKFWESFCALIGLDGAQRDDTGREQAVRTEVARLIGAKDAAHWEAVFAGHDVCCSRVRTKEEAMRDPHFAARGLFARTLRGGERPIPALPVPVAERFRSADAEAAYPRLGEANDLLG